MRLASLRPLQPPAAWLTLASAGLHGAAGEAQPLAVWANRYRSV